MKCAKCHFENPDDSVYCSTCGIQLASSEEVTITQKTKTLEPDESKKELKRIGIYKLLEVIGKGEII